MGDQIHWIEIGTPGRLGILTDPMKIKFQTLKEEGVNVVVSLLSKKETQNLLLENEAQLCRKAGLLFLSCSIPEQKIPFPPEAADELILSLAEQLQSGMNLALHGKSGTGRTGIIASAILIKCGQSADDALKSVATARGQKVPDTDEQKKWVEEFARRAPQA